MEISFIDGALLKKALKGAARNLDINKEEINALNVFPVPDGDTGTNMSLTMHSAVKHGLAVEENNAYKVALATSQGSLMGARGNSGVILSQLFRGFALGIDSKENIDIRTLAECFKEAADTAYKAVMKPTEGTILTVARACGDYAIKNYNKFENILEFFEKIIEAGNEALNQTPEMLAVLKEAGVVDAGGKGWMTILTGAYNSLTGVEIEEEKSLEEQELEFQAVVEHRHMDVNDIKFSYCTEFMVNGDVKEADVDRFRNFLSLKGDSLMVVEGDGLIKVHVHTNNPGLALEKALELGALSDIKIDNMKFQYEQIEKNKEAAKKASKKYSFVSVSAGDGIGQIFKELGVDSLVEGGQTMNPSTEDISKAINNSPGENVFVLPNNGNIILAAEQSKELSEKNVIVLPTKTIPQGISALFEFDESLSVEENEVNMRGAISEVKTGQVTYSVRDSEISGKKIKKDDFMGLREGDIVVAGEDKAKVIDELIDSMVDDDSSLISVLFGKDIPEEEAKELEDNLSNKYDDLDIEVVYGGQPIYYYIISVE